MDGIYGNENITTLFFEKYKTLYNSVPTNNSELTVIQDVVHRGISYAEFNRFRITPFIIGQRIIQLNPLTTRLLKMIHNWIITSVVYCVHTMVN